MQGSLPAGWLAFTGRELNPLDRDEGFQITSSSLPGLFLAQRSPLSTLPVEIASRRFPQRSPLLLLTTQLALAWDRLLIAEPEGPPCMRRLLSRLIFKSCRLLGPTWLSLAAARSDGQRWPKAIAKRLAVASHEHEHGGRLTLVKRRWQADVGQATHSENRRRQFEGARYQARRSRASLYSVDP